VSTIARPISVGMLLRPKSENTSIGVDGTPVAALSTGGPYFAGINESSSVGDITKMIRKPRNPVLE
jgi:hypothetical protein